MLETPKTKPGQARARSNMSKLESNTTWFIPLLIFAVNYLALSYNIGLAHLDSDFRCSHVPPTPEQATHVWLNDANFSFPSGDNENFEVKVDVKDSIGSRSDLESNLKIKTKRHINSRRYLIETELSPLFNMPKKQEPNAIFDQAYLMPIKINVYYDNSVFLLDKTKTNLITETVMPTVVKYFENVLSIRRENSIDRFRIARRCPNNTIYYSRDSSGTSKAYCMDRCEDFAICGEMVVPSSHLAACSYCNSTSRRCVTDHSSEGKGVANTQLLLYVSSKQTARCRKDQTIAYAAHCAQDAKTDRPVAGHANLCPLSISTDTKDLRALIATVKHELTHVLGFSISLFAYYRDEYGRPLTERDPSPGPIPVDPITGYARWGDKIIKKVTRTDWLTGEGTVDKEVHLMVTPNVVREVQSHFNCSTLEGAELEDQGSDGTSLTHWEKRLFENEAMTGTHTQNSVYSRLTLAVLQDTGWYVANFSRADRLDWGKNLGCDFAQKSCKSWIDDRRAANQSIRPFCDRIKGDVLQIACSTDRTSKAVCNMKHYKDPLPLAYQNFDSLSGINNESLAHYGGSVDLADYCPFIQEFTWQTQNVTIRGSRCDFINNIESEKSAALEHYGSQTRCFEHERRWEQRSCIYKRHWHHYGAGCYKYTCTNGHFNVMVGNHTYSCYYPNQVIQIEQMVDQWLYNGTIVCPECDKICPAQTCKSYDKRVIDKILSLNHESLTDLESEEFLRAFIDDSINAVETKNDLDLKIKLKMKQVLNELSSNDTLEITKYNDHLRYQEYLTIYTQHKNPPKHYLKCSSATSIHQAFIHVLLIVSSIITLLLNTRISSTMKK